MGPAKHRVTGMPFKCSFSEPIFLGKDTSLLKYTYVLTKISLLLDVHITHSNVGLWMNQTCMQAPLCNRLLMQLNGTWYLTRMKVQHILLIVWLNTQ